MGNIAFGAVEKCMLVAYKSNWKSITLCSYVCQVDYYYARVFRNAACSLLRFRPFFASNRTVYVSRHTRGLRFAATFGRRPSTRLVRAARQQEHSRASYSAGDKTRGQAGQRTDGARGHAFSAGAARVVVVFLSPRTVPNSGGRQDEPGRRSHESADVTLRQCGRNDTVDQTLSDKTPFRFSVFDFKSN